MMADLGGRTPIKRAAVGSRIRLRRGREGRSVPAPANSSDVVAQGFMRAVATGRRSTQRFAAGSIQNHRQDYG